MSQNINPEVPEKEADLNKSSNLFDDELKENLCHINDKVNDWEVDEIRQKVCVDVKDLRDHADGNKYCLFHLPSKYKTKEFEARLREKLAKIEEDIEKNGQVDEPEEEKAEEEISYDFRYVFFPYADFDNYTFNSTVNFKSATFASDIYFNDSVFTSKADFFKATFESQAVFSSAIFKSAADFTEATFEEKSLIAFAESNFHDAIRFNFATFKGYVKFEGTQENQLFISKESMLELHHARIDDAKKLSFDSVRLEPNWFINIDAGDFSFTNCNWRYADGKRLKTKTELKKLEKMRSDNPNAFLTKICWQLADNYEESKSFTKSSMFRAIANESKRLETSWHPFRKRFWEWQPLTLHWWYYAVSFYGEDWRRAFYWLIGIMLVSGLFYEWFGVFQTADSTEFYNMTGGEGLIHSLYVAALQRPEPKAADNPTKLIIILETIFAPLQAALLALAIRRKFMR